MENQKNRLRRAKMKGFISISFKIGDFVQKIAPEGREIFLGRKFFHLTKTKKKTLTPQLAREWEGFESQIFEIFEFYHFLG